MKKQALCVAGALTVFCVVMWLAPWSLSSPKNSFAGDWPQWRYDAGRGAASPNELPTELHLQWVRQLPEPCPAWPASQPWLRFDLSYSPVAAGKMLFVPSMVTDTVTAYDTDNGEEKWRFTADGPVSFAPIAHRGKVYFGSDDGYLYCIDGAEGTLLWRFRGGPSDRRVLGNERLISTWPIRGGPVLFDGTIYFTAGIWSFMGIFVHAVDAESGEAVWTNSGAGSTYTVQPHNSPAFAGLVPRGHLAATEHGLIVPGGRTMPGCYDLKTGEFRYFSFGEKDGGSHHVTARDRWFFVAGAIARIADGKPVQGVFPSVHDEEALYSLRQGEIVAQSPETEEKVTETRDRRGKKIKSSKGPTLKQLWKLPLDDAPSHLFLKAGSRLVTGGEGEVAVIETNSLKRAAKVVWRGSFEGTPWTMLAADGKLFVVTVEGCIYCFGEKWGTPKTYRDPAAGRSRPHEKVSSPETDRWQRHAEAILKATRAGDGYCVVLGLGSGGLAEALVRRSNLHLIAIDADAEKVDAFRRRMQAAGLYGTRVAAHAGDPLRYRLPPYLANLIVSEDPRAVRVEQGKPLIDAVFGTLRPYGGVACLPVGTEPLRQLVDRVRPANARVKAAGKTWSLLVREGALPGAADWTHQYADAAASVVSQDQLAKAPMGLLWFGNGPPNDEVLPRHGHGPAPQVAAGRLLIEGPDMIRALDIYTGRLLWQKKLPGLGRYYDNTAHQPGANAIGSNYVSLEDTVYIVYGKTILALDAATGQLNRQFKPPAGPQGSRPNWGFIAAWEDRLIATATPVIPKKPTSEGELAVLAGFTRIIQPNAQWQYLAGKDPPADWTSPKFSAGGWKTGTAGFGFGDEDDRTVLADMQDKYQRVYVRRRFDGKTVADAAEMALVINYDDAFIAYLNGKEVVRAGVGRGNGKSASKVQEHEAEEYEKFAIRDFRKLLRPDLNVLAIEGHNVKSSSSDFTLDPCLVVKSGKQQATAGQGNGAEPSPIRDELIPVQYASSSLTLVALDRHTGKQLWEQRARYGFRHNSIAIGAGKVFCIDGISTAQREALRRRGNDLKDYRPRLMALDVNTGKEIWSTEEDVFGTFLNYSAEYDVLLQAGSAARDRALDETNTGMVAYRGKDGKLIWKNLQWKYSGPCLLHHDSIIAQGPAYSLLTGKRKTRRHPLSGEPMEWEYKRNYGCNTAVASEHLLTFRSAAAGYYDLARDGGTGNFGGFKSGCTSNLIVAGGLLNAPEYTRTCTCRYQNQTSLALIHDPEVETWTFNPFRWDGQPVRRVGINFNAPGDRMADNGTLWLDWPSVGGPSPDIPVELEADRPDYFRYHASHVRVDPDRGELNWVAASGIRDLRAVTLTLAGKNAEPRSYTIRLHFAEVEQLEPGERVFDVLLQGKRVLKDFDVVQEAGGRNRAVVKEFAGVRASRQLKVSFAPRSTGGLPPVLCGIEIVAEGW